MMRKKNPTKLFLALAALLVMLILFLNSQDDSSDERELVTQFSGFAMQIPYRVVIGQTLTPEQSDKVEALLTKAFDEIDDRYNHWNPQSELSHLNRLEGGKRVVLSPELAHFMALVDRMVEITEGRFDPTIQPLREVWMPHLEAGTTPPQEELAAIRSTVGWQHVHLNDREFYKDSDGVRLNFDAIAKGFAVDLISHFLSQAGYHSTFVEWGGEIKAVGHHPQGRPWRVYISGIHSSDVAEALDFVTLENAALATSGDYHQQWTVSCATSQETMTVCHVFDPLTQKPLKVCHKSIASASVMASSCAAADALATAAMVFPNAPAAKAWAGRVEERYPSFRFWLADR